MTAVTAGIYAGHTFPPYEYREYPKHVQKNGKTFVANSKGEELRIASMPDEYEGEPALSIDAAAHEAALAEIAELKAQLAAKANPPKPIGEKKIEAASEKKA